MTIEIGLILALAGGIIGIATFYIGRQSAAKKDGHEWGAFTTELKKDIEYIKRDVGEIKNSVGESNQELRASIRRVHRRIDEHLRNEHQINTPKYDNMED